MVILYVILVLAFVFRLASLTFGLPHSDVFGDEIVHTVLAFKMLNAKTILIPYGESYLPPLFSYILMPIFVLIGFFGKLFGYFSNLADYKEFVLLHREWMMIPGRIISALFGTASIYFLYLLVEKIFNRKIALLSAFLLAVDFLSVHESQIGHIWSPVAFFFVFGAFSLYSLYLTGLRRWYIYSALAVGFGYAIGQAPILLIFLFIFIHYLVARKNSQKFWNKNLAVFTSVFAPIFLAFSLVNYYTLYKHFIEAAGSILKILGIHLQSATEISNVVGKTSVSHSWSVGYKTLLYTTPAVLLAGIAGALVYLKKKKIVEIGLFIIFPAFYFLFILLTTDLTYRYVLPIVPFLAIFSAYLVFCIYEKIAPDGLKFGILTAMIIVLTFYPTTSIFLYSFKLLKPYTVSQAVEWTYKNIPSGSRIVSNVYLNSSKGSINFTEKNNEFNWLDSRKKFLLDLDDKKYPQPNYFVIDTNLTDASKLSKEEKWADYFLLFFYDKPNEEKKIKNMAEFSGQKELIAKFYPQNKKDKSKDLLNFNPHWILSDLLASSFIGPYVEIYKTVK